MSILSSLPDGFGFYYGFLEGDHRQINVRHEDMGWTAYVGGDPLPDLYVTKDEAEKAAIKWARENPE